MTTIHMHDAFVLDGVRKSQDGYLTAFAKVARTGVQVYRGAELGRPDLAEVRLYRPPEEVFSADAMRSLANRPVTLRHPSVPVTAKNWKQHARGYTGEDVVRDGDFVRVPLILTDAGLVDAYEKQGIKELSVGYSTDIKWTRGVVADGQPDAGKEYDAVQTAIRGNHLAVVPVARGGDQLRIGDEGVDDAWNEEDHPRDAKGMFTNTGSDTGDTKKVAEKFRDLLKSHGLKASRSRYNDDIDEPGDFKEVIVKYTPENEKKVNELAKKFPGIDHKQTYIENGQIHIYTHEFKGKKNAKDSACPECGAEMTGKTCPECNYVKDTGETDMKTLVLDGFTVQVADDNHASIITRVVDGLRAELKTVTDSFDDFKKKKKEDDEASEKKMKDAATTIAAKDGEIAVLKKQVADAVITPAKLDVLVKERQGVFDAAAKVLGKDYVFDGKTITEVKRAAVVSKLGDAATKDMDDATIGGAFAALTATVQDNGGTRPINDAFANRRPGNGGTSVQDAAYEEMRKNLEGNWKSTAA